MRSPLLRADRFAAALLAASVLVAIAGAVIVFGGASVEAHLGHQEKKLFGGRWYQQVVGGDYGAWMTLSTSPPYYYCDGPTPPNPGANPDVPSCTSKWSLPAQQARLEWEAQPTTVDFPLTSSRNIYNDVEIYIIDILFGNPGILGVAQVFDASEQFCNLDNCTYRYGNAVMADDPHSGLYTSPGSRRVTVLHELGHLLSLRHESVNASESVRYECGFDNTGVIPHSVMSYDCIHPLGVGGAGEFFVQDWDTCAIIAPRELPVGAITALIGAPLFIYLLRRA